MATAGTTIDDDETDSGPQDFETALEACGFGLFNICLIIATVPGIAANVFETSTMSYILPTAECDLKLSLVGKGALNGITYAGMIVAAVPWGYFADTNGRIHVLIYGLFAEFVFVLCSALSQNYLQLLFFKFFAGACACGPFAVVMSFVSEFHSRHHRARIMMLMGVLKSTAIVILPIMAYLMLPYHWSFSIDWMNFHTWHIFVSSTAIPSLVGGSLLSFFPESPKFLMSQGRNAEALKIFQRVYAINTRKDQNTYPVKTLFEETPEKAARRAAKAAQERQQRTLMMRGSDARKSLREGIDQLRPMFSPPYLGHSVMVYMMAFCILIGQNTLRLWMPQLFASIVEFEEKGLGVPSMCAILEHNVNKTRLTTFQPVEEDCDLHISPGSYVNNIIIGLSAFVGYLLATLTVNIFGNNNILIFCLFVATCCDFALYFSGSAMSTLIIAAISSAVSGVAVTTVISVSVNLFPTAMRTMVVVMVMTFGRLGSLLGNVLFPLLMTTGCLPTFLAIGGVLLCAFFISLFLPNATRVNLK